MDENLDQLWYTWSTNGLGSMPMGYRVRAASGELHDTQSMRYRRVDRFLRYELPQGININEFDSKVAPVSLAFVNNGEERLLIRKVFKGRDLAGRNSVFFTHLIAGLPPSFTARDAIRLWHCPDLWVESEERQRANDTLLPPLPYSTLKFYTERAQPLFQFVAIRQQLEHALALILAQGLPAHLHTVGQPELIAALIYGITHCLPLTMLKDLTFSTYESNVNDCEAVIVGTVNGTDLSDPTHLEIGSAAQPVTTSIEIKNYVNIALTCLVTGKMDKLNRLIKKTEEYNYQAVEQLMAVFTVAFQQGPLTVKQIEAIFQHPADYNDNLLDPGFQQECASLLLKQPDYWQQRGHSIFAQVAKSLAAQQVFDQATCQTLQACLNGMAHYIIEALREGLRQVKELEGQGMPQDKAFQVPRHCGHLLTTLFPPAQNAQIWLRLLSEFAQPPMYAYLKSNSLWPFHRWLLEQAKSLPQPQLVLPQVKTWLDIPSWDKLEEALALALPAEWAYEAIYGRILDVPRGAVPVVQRYEKLFTGAFQQLLQQNNQVAINTAAHFFQCMIEYKYPDRVTLLLTMINACSEASFVQVLFACINPRLDVQEVHATLAGCRPEVIATCGRAPALAQYLQEFILSLSPGKLSTGNIASLLGQLNRMNAGSGFAPLLPDYIADLVSHWQIISIFLNTETISRQLLKDLKTAVQRIFTSSTQDQIQTFASEFVPILVNQAKTELEIETILEILGTTLTKSRWDLLRWMAMLVGANKTQLCMLIPYLLCGVREAERTGQPASDLDIYLHSLCVKLDRDALRSIDTAAADGIWPGAVRQRWENWRGRKKGFQVSLPRGNTGRLPSAPQQQPLVLPGQTSYSPPAQTVRDGYDLSAQTRQKPQQTGKPIAILSALNRSISTDEYTRTHRIMPYVLAFWLERKFPAESKDYSKSFASEIKLLRQIKDELTQHSEYISDDLATYLADDILIEEEAKRLGKNSTELDPDRYIRAEFVDFQTYVQERQLSPNLANASSEPGVWPTLRILIRRYLFIKHLEDQKGGNLFGRGGIQAFLEKERKNAQFKMSEV